MSVEICLGLYASSLIKSDCPVILLLFKLLECQVNLCWFEVVAGGRGFETDCACVHLDFWCYELGKPAHLTDTLLLVEVLKGRLVHIFLSDVQEEVDLVQLTDALDQGSDECFPFQILRVYIYASLPQYDFDNLKLAEHVLQVCLELLRLPITKLFISVLVVECDGLIALDYLRPISLILITLHDTYDGFMP